VWKAALGPRLAESGQCPQWVISDILSHSSEVRSYPKYQTSLDGPWRSAKCLPTDIKIISANVEMYLDRHSIFQYLLKYEKGSSRLSPGRSRAGQPIGRVPLAVQAGPDGMPAGRVAEALGLAPNTLTFHFDRLRDAGLVTVRRDG
jgi:DNA-binding transcriptional ArsR family regulator